MWTLSIHKILLLNICFVDTNIIVDAFYSSIDICSGSSRIRPPQRITTSNGLKLWFYPKLEESGPDFHTPAQSFTLKGATSTRNSKNVSYLDVVPNRTANNSLISGVTEDVLYHTSIPVTDIDDTRRSSSSSSSSSFISDEPLAQARLIQEAYQEWCEFYGKIPSKDRLAIFSSNFLAVQEYHKKTGRPLVLNEFADQTEEEYKQEDKQPSTDDNKLIMSSETFIVEDRIRGAYREWCEYYGRSYDETYLKAFASNFVEKYRRQTKNSLPLNEFAGMTENEYERHLAKDTNFVSTTEHNIAYENNGYKRNDDHNSTSVFQDSTEAIEPNNNDPITAYLDPNPIGYSHVDKMQLPNIQPPIPNSQTQLVHNSNNFSNRDSSESSNINGVLSALLSTVSSLSTVAQSLTTGSSQSMPPSTGREEPLNSLVMDVLQQQDGSITQLEDSIEGLREIQVQSSDLIQLVSQNQMQMTKMMAAVQLEVASLQSDQEQFDRKKSLLVDRIDKLEARIAEYESTGPSSRRTPTLETHRRKIVRMKPNLLQAMGDHVCMLNWDNSPKIISKKTNKQ